MTSSAETVLDDFLAATLAGTRPVSKAGDCANHTVRWQWLDQGVLLLEPQQVSEAARSVLLSAGVHGDETAPIELLSKIVADIAAGRLALACRVLVVLGNVAAMRAATRYQDDDLNRLFGGRHARVPQSREAPRAVALEAAAQRFFADASNAPGARWHLDMHTAIRASAFEQFALLPYTGGAPTRAMFDWLADARIAAVLIHTEKGATYSSFTADHCGATACTLELGKVRPFGENDLARFANADAAVRRLVANATKAPAPMPRVFTVIGQITKQSDAFALHVAADVPNFTPFARGTVLAEDGAYRYVVAHDEERIVFPNPTVKPGLRAGLLVVETTDETLATLV
ncbi:MAG TPA: succinylglutamate desuccinylase [Paraburkholderia sp.]|jgi:succinylglutamate desuccinylase|uniref:succinylglutamate desuccinylase n=1 Tax=Paraburkholderia sp. TaxID=1926495 RepID=UPI002DE72A7E|nr:succinylglutamate desuccinylase [Paraburkholderia sp.]